MKRLMLLLLVVFAYCGKKDTPSSPAPVEEKIKPEGMIIATNGASKRLEIFDAALTDWNSSGAMTWSWRPLVSLGFTTAEVNTFGGGTDAKLRNIGNDAFLAITDNRMAIIIAYPAGEKKWSQIIDGNLHAAELLPNGNLAVAASDANWIRVYATSQGPAATKFASFPLIAAHAVLWDPALNLLWVTGQIPGGPHVLTALTVSGTAAEPVIAEDLSRRSELPSLWGHDVSPYYGDANKLWVSTNGGTYVYDKPSKRFSGAPGGSNRTFVKAVSNLPSGLIIQTQPDANKTPGPAVSCSLNDWSTSTVDIYSPKGSFQENRIATSACFYKAKVLSNKYQ